ncbi:MAG: hypothetical protein ACQEXJ_23065 [Myxococcota bacterium]
MRTGDNLRRIAFAVAGIAALGAGVYLLVDQVATGRLEHSVVLVIALFLAGAIFTTLALRAPSGGGEGAEPLDYRHVARLFTATAGVALLMGAGLEGMMPEGFGETGFYRAGAVADARAGTSRHVGEAACAECHDEQVRLHDKDAHARVACEVCHGPGVRHEEWHRANDPAADVEAPEEARMRIRDDRDWCLHCHEVDPARPGSFPQIAWREHMEVSGVRDEDIPCGTCHDPHEPLFMGRDLREARLHPLVHRCEDCHGAGMDEDRPLPDRHVATFECSYCHEEISRKTLETPHADLDCTTCHVFFKESAFAGRIVRDTDPQFCLLCHAKADFRSEDAPPGISWPSHRDVMARSDEDDRQHCVECHRPVLHWPEEAPKEPDVEDLWE